MFPVWECWILACRFVVEGLRCWCLRLSVFRASVVIVRFKVQCLGPLVPMLGSMCGI